MNAPWPLPDGLTWREVTSEDLKWLTRKGQPEPVASDYAAIHITITIRHPDGRKREYVDDWYPFLMALKRQDTLIDGVTYQWTDGNFGCDCNRASFHAYPVNTPNVTCAR